MGTGRKIHPEMLKITDLSKTNYKEEIIDMTGYTPTEPTKDDDSKIYL